MQKKVFTQQNFKKQLIRIAFTAVFTALAVVVKSFTNLALNIPGVGIKIGFAGIFTFFPAAFCGPIFGGIASGLTDVLGYLIAPDGAYIPWLTLTAFCGGVIKGLLWMLLTKKAAKKVRIILISVFAVIGIFGASVNISLCADGVMKGVIAQQSELPLRGEAEQMELSPLSKLTVGLARYNKDTVTLTRQSGNTLYTYYELAGYKNTVTKIGKGALSDCEGELYIPKTYKTIADDAGAEKVTVIKGEEGSAAQKYAEKIGVPFEVSEVEELTANENSADAAFSSSDAYRKNLAAYINLLAFGLELTGLVGILFVVLNIVLSKADKGEDGQSRALGIMRIAVACVVTGVIVTTVNTFILKEVLEVWSGRAVLVLLIPRVAEEILSCTLQAYIISLLFGIIYRGKLRQYIDKLS
jgi:ECF transporter S component (folate family)